MDPIGLQRALTDGMGAKASSPPALPPDHVLPTCEGRLPAGDCPEYIGGGSDAASASDQQQHPAAGAAAAPVSLAPAGTGEHAAPPGQRSDSGGNGGGGAHGGHGSDVAGGEQAEALSTGQQYHQTLGDDDEGVSFAPAESSDTDCDEAANGAPGGGHATTPVACHIDAPQR